MDALRLLLAVTLGPTDVPAPATVGMPLSLADAGGSSAQQADIPALQQGSISGEVIGPAGHPLAGALVRLEQTGEEASADDSGRFQFTGLPPGRYTVTASFLGFEPVNRPVEVAAGSLANARLVVERARSDDQPIIVYGSRSARAKALNLQRTAENNSDVVSADDLGDFTGTTISEGMRRIAGVAFQRDPLTGDGVNVVIRGLEPDMNTIKLDGLTLPVGNGTSRSANLSNLLADSVRTITVNKSLLPRHDSSGTGGLIEIETLSPLDLPRRYARLQLEGGRSDHGFAKDLFASGTLSARFGAGDRFGLSASLQYRRNEARTISYSLSLNYGRFLPLDAQGLPTITTFEQVDPLLTFPFSPGGSDAFPNRLETRFNHVRQSTLAGTLAAEWQVAEQTDLRFSAFRSETKRTSYALTDVFSVLSRYADQPGGEPLAELRLDLTPGNQSLRRQQSYAYDRRARIRTSTYSLSGRTVLGQLTLDALIGLARGTERHPRQFGMDLHMPDSDARPEYFSGAATDPAIGAIVSPFGPRRGDDIPLPLFTDAGWAFVDDPSGLAILNAGGQIDAVRGSNSRATAKMSARYDGGPGALRYVEVGFHLERSKFRSDRVRQQLGGNVPVSALGLRFSPSDLARIGVDDAGFTILSEDELAAFVGRIDAMTGTTPLTLTPIVPHPDQHKQFTSEAALAAYIQSALKFGKLEIVGGARLDRTRLRARNLIFPTYIGPILPENGGGFGLDFIFQNAFTMLVDEEKTATDILPRVLFNYRANDNLILRGGYFLSVARPQIEQLSTQTRITFINIPIPGPAGVKPIVEITTGNPHLKPATTHNFDLGIEHYSDRIGVMRLSGFYKRIRNLLQSNVTSGALNLEDLTLPDHPYFQGPPFFDPANPQNFFINGRRPANSPHSAFLWGVEAQLERRFTFLPGVWSGLGAYANYTFTKSSRTERYFWPAAPSGQEIYEFSSVPFVQQPKHSGTAALTYNRYGIDATLAYGFQSRALNHFAPRGLGFHSEKVRTLDLRAEYSFRTGPGRFRFYCEASDLLKNHRSPDVMDTFGGEGDTPKFHTRATYLGGRRFKFGIAATF